MGRKSKEIGKEAKELTIKIYEEGKAHAHIAELLDVIRKFQSTGSVKNNPIMVYYKQIVV
jgi:hypothetical protein